MRYIKYMEVKQYLQNSKLNNDYRITIGQTAETAARFQSVGIAIMGYVHDYYIS